MALALANNPDLQAARLRGAVAAAQTVQARVRVNPSLTGAFLPLISGVGVVSAWNIGLSQDIKTLITYRARVRVAEASERQVAADLVWREWQVAGQARQLAVELIMTGLSRPSYVATYQILAARNARLERALAQRNTTLAIVAPDRVALQAARSALDALDQRRLSLAHQLDALLGLAPDVQLSLATSLELPSFDPRAIRAELTQLPQRRPDLLALRLGYAAADDQVRLAILGRFPDLVLGATGASDSSRVINAGPSATVGLPIFDRNQGGIALAEATRAQLRADYAARLATTRGEVEALLSEAVQLAGQLAVVRRDLPAAEFAARRAQAAFGASNLDERAYVDLLANRFAKEQEITTLELALLDRQVAIDTLVGAGLPTMASPGEPGGAEARR